MIIPNEPRRGPTSDTKDKWSPPKTKPKPKPLIRPIQVFKQFDPEDYLEYCTEEGETPTQEGFRQFLGNEIPKDFEILDNS